MESRHEPIAQFVSYLDHTYPFDAFLKNLTPTALAGVYENPDVAFEPNPDKPTIIIINGTTGSGKDTLLEYLTKHNLGHKATTAVNRIRRPNEPEDSMIWMRQPRSDESPTLYHQNLIKEYDLVEYNTHHNNLYGLPRYSLEQAIAKGVAIVRNEPNGARTLTKKLSDSYTILVLFLIPDSWVQVYDRINTPHQKRDSIRTRLEDSLIWVEQSKQVTHFYIHNSIHPETYGASSKNALNAMCRQVQQLLIKKVFPAGTGNTIRT